MKKTLLIFLICKVLTSFAQNANWGTGLPVTVTVNSSSLDLSVFDPIISQTKTTSLSVGSNPIYQNSDGVVVGAGSSGTMYYATYDLELHTWKSSFSSIGNSNMDIKTSNGVVVGTGSSGTMYYATYDAKLQTWKSSFSSIGNSNMDIKTSDGVVVGTGSSGTMYYATYDVELQTWKSSFSSIGSSNMNIQTKDGVVVGTGSSGTMYYATYDVELQTWKSSFSSIGSSNMVIETSDGVVVGIGSSGTMYYAIYDFNLDSWKTSFTSIGSSGVFTLSSGTISYSGSSSGTKGYNTSSQSWGSSPTSPSCKLLPVSFSGSNWSFMRCMSMGASSFTYSCGDGHQISRKQGWKKYNTSNTYTIDLNVSNGVGNSSCDETINIISSISDILKTNNMFTLTSKNQVIFIDEMTHKNYTFSVSDVFGRVIEQGIIKDQDYILQNRTLGEGMYVLTVFENGHVSGTKKFVYNK